MFKQVATKGKTIYVGTAVRDRLDKIVLDIRNHVGRSVTVNGFLRYLIERSADDTRDNLKSVLGSAEERRLFEKEQ